MSLTESSVSKVNLHRPPQKMATHDETHKNKVIRKSRLSTSGSAGMICRDQIGEVGAAPPHRNNDDDPTPPKGTESKGFGGYEKKYASLDNALSEIVQPSRHEKTLKRLRSFNDTDCKPASAAYQLSKSSESTGRLLSKLHSSVLERLRENDPRREHIFLDLDYSRYSTSFRGLLAALGSNTTLTSVRAGSRFLSGLSTQEGVAFFGTMSKMEGLRRVYLTGPVPVDGLKLFLESATRLRVFGLNRVTLQGTCKDFSELFEHGFHGCTSIVEITLRNVVFETDRLRLSVGAVDSLVRTLACAPNLAVLKIQAEGGDTLSPIALAEILKAPKLQKLCLHESTMEDKHINLLSLWRNKRRSERARDIDVETTQPKPNVVTQNSIHRIEGKAPRSAAQAA